MSSSTGQMDTAAGCGCPTPTSPLTDVASSRIIRNVMTPRFKAGDYDQGIELGVAAIVAQLEGRGDAASSASVVMQIVPRPFAI